MVAIVSRGDELISSVGIVGHLLPKWDPMN